MESDLILAGLTPPPTVITATDDEGDDFEVWEENWESLEWFLKLSRRWVFNQFNGKRLRFDDQAAMTQFKIHGVKKAKRQAIMDDLLAMEDVVLEVLNRE